MVSNYATLFLLAGMLTTVPAVVAQQGNYSTPSPPSSRGGTLSHFVPPPVVLREVGPNDDLLRELLAILNETRSPDAFLVTLSILQELKPEPREAVPVIIRNAERLRLFKRTDPDKGTEQQRMILECIGDLLRKESEPAAPRYEPCGNPVSTSPELLNLPQPAEESETEESSQPTAAAKGPLALSEQDVLRVICRFLELQCLGRGKPHAGEACVGRVKSSAVLGSE
jgi:hypothetical protein